MERATSAAKTGQLESIRPFQSVTPNPGGIQSTAQSTIESDRVLVSTRVPTLVPGLIGPNHFPAQVNPLTGEVVDDASVLDRRPIAVKISNIASTRPQAGLNSADLIFEHTSEGGITRFTAIFYSKDSTRVGSIRSGRLIDLEIPLMYDAAFAYSGSSSPIRQMIRDSIFYDRVISPDFAHGGFERVLDEDNPSAQYVDSLFTDTTFLRWILRERQMERRPNLQAGTAFLAEPPAGGTAGTEVEIEYGATNIYWSYNPGTKRYERWSDGQVHLDANTGEQVSFKNVVIVGARHIDSEIDEDRAGNPSIQIQIWGTGPAILYRDGLRFDARWQRTERAHMLSFYDLDGNILPFSLGNTFFEVVPQDGFQSGGNS